MEDNRDLKGALCRLIRISEQNEAALRLLEEENEELSGLVHRLTIGQTKALPAATVTRTRPWWQRGWSGAQPQYPPPSRQETHAGPHVVPGTQHHPYRRSSYQRP